jgi:hypothetical protein
MKIAQSGFTNDLGEYRLSGMEPGDYYISASYSARARDVPLFGALLTPNLSNPDAGYVTQYFPAAVSPPNAMVFTMLSNAEKTNLNFTLQDVERFKVHVQVSAASNLLSHHFNIAMMPEGAELEDAKDYVVHDVEGTSGADFEIADVGVGHYSLVAFDKARILSEPTPITVNRNTEAKVVVYDPVDIPGVIVDEYDVPVPGKWSVRLVRADPDIGQTIRVDADSGNFVFPDVGPAAYDVYVDGLPLGLYIKEVQFPVNDGLDHFGRIRIEPERPKRIQEPTTLRWRTEPMIRVVLAKSDLVVVGNVSTDPGFLKGVPGAQLVLEPDRQTDRIYAQREDRFITGIVPSAFFRWVGVPPGTYEIFAFMDIPPGLYFDLQFNDRIWSKGVRGAVTDGPVLADRIFDMTGCVFPPYVDPIFQNANPPLGAFPPADTHCVVPISREETAGIAP